MVLSLNLTVAEEKFATEDLEVLDEISEQLKRITHRVEQQRAQDNDFTARLDRIEKMLAILTNSKMPVMTMKTEQSACEKNSKMEASSSVIQETRVQEMVPEGLDADLHEVDNEENKEISRKEKNSQENMDFGWINQGITDRQDKEEYPPDRHLCTIFFDMVCPPSGKKDTTQFLALPEVAMKPFALVVSELSSTDKWAKETVTKPRQDTLLSTGEVILNLTYIDVKASLWITLTLKALPLYSKPQDFSQCCLDLNFVSFYFTPCWNTIGRLNDDDNIWIWDPGGHRMHNCREMKLTKNMQEVFDEMSVQEYTSLICLLHLTRSLHNGNLDISETTLSLGYVSSLGCAEDGNHYGDMVAFECEHCLGVDYLNKLHLEDFKVIDEAIDCVEVALWVWTRKTPLKELPHEKIQVVARSVGITCRGTSMLHISKFSILEVLGMEWNGY